VISLLDKAPIRGKRFLSLSKGGARIKQGLSTLILKMVCFQRTNAHDELHLFHYQFSLREFHNPMPLSSIAPVRWVIDIRFY
jgi:hypothetical protein